MNTCRVWRDESGRQRDRRDPQGSHSIIASAALPGVSSSRRAEPACVRRPDPVQRDAERRTLDYGRVALDDAGLRGGRAEGAEAPPRSDRALRVCDAGAGRFYSGHFTLRSTS